MSTGVQERTWSPKSLSDLDWQPPQTDLPVDITSGSRLEEIPFGEHTIVIMLLEPLSSWSSDLLAKISELGNLEEGWDSYGARPVDPQCAVAAVEFLLYVLDASLPKPSIVPTNRGGIQLEWHRAGADLEIEIESPTRLHVFFEDEQDGREDEVTLSGNLKPVVPFLERLKAMD